MTIKPEEIVTLVELFAASDWDELHVEINGLQLFLSTNPAARLTSDPAPQFAPFVAPATVPFHAPPAAVAPTATGAGVASAVDPAPSSWVAVNAPNLGTFYRAAKPGARPFVEVGHSVDPSTELCLLEVMKLFTTVRAGTKGMVRRICAADGDMVEFGQTLFYIEPA